MRISTLKVDEVRKEADRTYGMILVRGRTVLILLVSYLTVLHRRNNMYFRFYALSPFKSHRMDWS